MIVTNEFLRKSNISREYHNHIIKIVKNDKNPKYEVHLSPMAFYANSSDLNSKEHIILADTIKEIEDKMNPQFVHISDVPKITSWEEILNDFEAYENMTCKPSIKKLPLNYIKDEDMSVKWNREYVERNNQQYVEELKQLNKDKNKALQNISNNCYALIRYDLDNKISFLDAQKIWNYADEQSHAFGFYDVINTLTDIIELMKSLTIFQK